jgi:hypothetical protein
VSGQIHAPTALHPGKKPPVPIGQKAGWASEVVWTSKKGNIKTLHIFRDENRKLWYRNEPDKSVSRHFVYADYKDLTRMCD